MAAVLLDDAVLDPRATAGLADAGLDGMGDVGEPTTGAGFGQPGPHRRAGDLGEGGDLGGDLADVDAHRRITVPAVDDRAEVDGEQVSLREDALPRDAVDDLVVHARADDGREAVVAEEGRLRSVVGEHIARDVVEISRRDTRRCRLGHRIEGGGDDESRGSHRIELTGGLELDGVLAPEHQAPSAARTRAVTSSTAPMPSTWARSPRER